jgi:Rps23 Pro-64 3,4-dihydroxylase Tpa1-like proline 4-hydroxylase|tara:strand:+ start:276 stop:917 length:642 start_codon:yes stop_codon:yes gene_type:complete
MIIVDDFLNDENFANISTHPLWVNKSSLDVTTNDNVGTRQKFHWKNKEDPAVNIFETLIHEVVDNLLQFTNPHQGYEYWLNTTIIGEGMPVHFDKDEIHMLNTQELRTPMLGMIYYAHTEIPEGGELIIHAYENKHEKILPVPNRLVVFNSSQRHEVTRVLSGLRRSVAINIWDRPPLTNEYLTEGGRDGKVTITEKPRNFNDITKGLNTDEV